MITEKIKKIFFEIKNNVNNQVKPYDLTAVQIITLNYLYDNNKKIVIQKNICDFLSLKHSTVINILKRLEEKELITKKTNYKSEIAITDKRKVLVKNVGATPSFVDNKLLKGFNKNEIEELNDYLDRIYSNINNL